MSYQVTARKWRPMIFDDVVGQGHVTNTLRNAIASNRVAHAYIFSGTRGCGKTTTARILARSLNCLSPNNQNPDNLCEVCKEIIEGRSMDVIEIDGASNRGVEEIRNLRDSVRYTPTHGKYKIYIIDEVHMLTKEAFNALLKTLEEPPAQVVFVFATTEIHKVPMTILSRCQRFDFRRIAIDEIVTTLTTIAEAEHITIEHDALMVIAKRADGSLRDAQSIFDQVRSFCGNDIKTAELLMAFNVVDQEMYFRLSENLRYHNASNVIRLVDEIIKNGYDLREFVNGLIEHLRNLLIVRSTESTKLIEISENYKKRYETEASQFTEQDLLRYIKQANELDQALRWAAQPRYRLEAALIQMAKMENAVQIGELLQQIEMLKKKISTNSGNATISATAKTLQNNSNQSSDLKVMGEVGAGYLKSKSAMSYSSLIGKELTSLSGPSKLAEFQPVTQRNAETAAIQNASAEDITSNWKAFIDSVSKSYIAVGTSLTETSILDVNNGMVRISCPDDYHFSTLKRNRDFLTNTLHHVVGKRVVIEPVLRSSADIPVKAVYTTTQSSSEDATKVKDVQGNNLLQRNEHPMLTLLKRELGAERIE
jgi:DNA polymerase III subunit gamma/tau